jgi:hypothetical protein
LILLELRLLGKVAGEKFKYHMTKWGILCLPEDYGGLGILNTRLMNEGSFNLGK